MTECATSCEWAGHTPRSDALSVLGIGHFVPVYVAGIEADGVQRSLIGTGVIPRATGRMRTRGSWGPE